MDHIPVEIAALLTNIGYAFCGGVVRLFLRPAKSHRKTAMLLLCCVICGVIGTPAAIAVFKLNPDWSNWLCTGLGLIGLSLAQRALKIADEGSLKDVVSELAKGSSRKTGDR